MKPQKITKIISLLALFLLVKPVYAMENYGSMCMMYQDQGIKATKQQDMVSAEALLRYAVEYSSWSNERSCYITALTFYRAVLIKTGEIAKARKYDTTLSRLTDDELYFIQKTWEDYVSRGYLSGYDYVLDDIEEEF